MGHLALHGKNVIWTMHSFVHIPSGEESPALLMGFWSQTWSSAAGLCYRPVHGTDCTSSLYLFGAFPHKIRAHAAVCSWGISSWQCEVHGHTASRAGNNIYSHGCDYRVYGKSQRCFLLQILFLTSLTPQWCSLQQKRKGPLGYLEPFLGLRTPSIFSIQRGGWWVHYHAAGPRTKRSHSVWPSYARNTLVFHGALLLCWTVSHHSSPSLLEALWDLQQNRKNNHWWVLTTQD